MRRTLVLLVVGASLGCPGNDPADSGRPDIPPADSGRADTGIHVDAAPLTDSGEDAGLTDSGIEGVLVTVTLDGSPLANAVVLQGGSDTEWVTNDQGQVVVTVDETVLGEKVLIGSHPRARTFGAIVFAGVDRVSIEMVSYDDSDNPAYVFSDPGEPDRRPGTAQCAHCHITINQDWINSPHKTAASNPTVQELYAGTASAFASAASCQAAGGSWLNGILPGTGARADRCYLGDGALAAVNPGCTPPCEDTATEFGACADCHAPGINGDIGDRNLLDATGFAYDYGVHCDVCHRVDEVDLTQAPGIGKRLQIMRPSETAPVGLGGGGFRPLTFGPSKDSPNPRMGSVARDHFRQATLCAGCHEQSVAPMRPGDALDAARWPSGVLPIQTTYSEWLEGPMSPDIPCQSCHMPPDPDVMNGGDLQLFAEVTTGIAGGWRRPAGSVRRHSWFGPRQRASRMLELAAALFIDKEVSGNRLTVRLRVKNVAAGHAIPTGEAMRSIVAVVAAECSSQELTATGGDAIPDFGGFVEQKDSTESWTVWTSPAVGDIVRVVLQPGGFYDYDGPLSFGRGVRDVTARGMSVETVVGESRVIGVTGGNVSFDQPLPAGDIAYLVRRSGLPEDGTAARELAGAAGFGFARVLTDAAGRRAVPHFVATDVASDNRLKPQGAHTSTHIFDTPCPDPVVRATLVYRNYPFWLAAERGWDLRDAVMTEVAR